MMARWVHQQTIQSLGTLAEQSHSSNWGQPQFRDCWENLQQKDRFEVKPGSQISQGEEKQELVMWQVRLRHAQNAPSQKEKPWYEIKCSYQSHDMRLNRTLSNEKRECGWKLTQRSPLQTLTAASAALCGAGLVGLGASVQMLQSHVGKSRGDIVCQCAQVASLVLLGALLFPGTFPWLWCLIHL